MIKKLSQRILVVLVSLIFFIMSFTICGADEHWQKVKAYTKFWQDQAAKAATAVAVAQVVLADAKAAYEAAKKAYDAANNNPETTKATLAAMLAAAAKVTAAKAALAKAVAVAKYIAAIIAAWYAGTYIGQGGGWIQSICYDHSLFCDATYLTPGSVYTAATNAEIEAVIPDLLSNLDYYTVDGDALAEELLTGDAIIAGSYLKKFIGFYINSARGAASASARDCNGVLRAVEDLKQDLIEIPPLLLYVADNVDSINNETIIPDSVILADSSTGTMLQAIEEVLASMDSVIAAAALPPDSTDPCQPENGGPGCDNTDAVNAATAIKDALIPLRDSILSIPLVDSVGNARKVGDFFPPDAFTRADFLAFIQECQDSGVTCLPAYEIYVADTLLEVAGVFFPGMPSVGPYIADYDATPDIREEAALFDSTGSDSITFAQLLRVSATILSRTGFWLDIDLDDSPLTQPKVLIPNTPCVNPGDYVTLPILLDKNAASFGGFELEVEFDYTSMCFVSAERGELLNVSYTDQEGVFWSWEYFTYRLLPCPIPPCQKYKIISYGQAEIPNGSKNRGLPIPTCEEGEGTLVNLNFVVMNNELLRGMKIPVCWEWEGTVVNDTLVEDWECSENTFSSASGDTLYTSTLLCQFNPDICDLPTDRIQPVLIFQDGICGQNCGGVDVCPAGPGLCKRGDVNMNTVTYEVADAVLFANYFVYGTGVFIHDEAYQICATDANADGRALTLSDLVYLIRVILHDAVEIPKLTPSSEVVNVTVSDNTVTTDCASHIGAILFEFDAAVVPTLLANSMEMLHKDNNVLVWSRDGHSIEKTAEVLTFTGDAELTSVSAVDRDSRELMTSIVGKAAPISFALNPAYPNPFNPYTNLSFVLPEAMKYSLTIYNVAGRLVRSYEGIGSVGLKVISWDSRDNDGEEVASGVYFYRLTAGEFSAVWKMVILK